MNEVSPDFAECWQSARRHLQQQGQGAISWLRSHLHPPMLEHLSFRLGNQLFFVRIDAPEAAPMSGGIAGALSAVAKQRQGHACVMPMRRTGAGWRPAAPGWGLLGIGTNQRVTPPGLITDENIEMSDWELQDFAVQTVRDVLEKEGHKLISWQGDPDVHPSLWFVGDHGPEWAVVRAVRYPKKDAKPPPNWAEIARSCSHLSAVGHFASVAVANASDTFDPGQSSPLPLWRGHRMYVSYPGLIRCASVGE